MIEDQNKLIHPSSDEYTMLEIKFKLVTFVAIIVPIIILRIAKIIYDKYFKHRIFIPKSTDNAHKFSCHLYIELLTPEDKEFLYLVSIGTSLMNVRIHGNTKVFPRSLEGSWYNLKLSNDWVKGTYFVYGKKYIYPQLVHVPILKRFKIQRMLKQDVQARLLILEDVFYGVLSLKELTEQNYKHCFGKPKNQPRLEFNTPSPSSQPSSPGATTHTPYTPRTPPRFTSFNTSPPFMRRSPPSTYKNQAQSPSTQTPSPPSVYRGRMLGPNTQTPSPPRFRDLQQSDFYNQLPRPVPRKVQSPVPSTPMSQARRDKIRKQVWTLSDLLHRIPENRPQNDTPRETPTTTTPY
jgi:hypothetical protein